MSDDPVLQLFTTYVARLVSVSPGGVGIQVTSQEGQVADEQPGVGSNRAAAASAGDSVLVSGFLVPATVSVMLRW